MHLKDTFLAGALKLQQNQVAASLVAASQTPQQRSSPAVHVEHLELSAGLRVAGDDAADSVRRRRAKRHVFEKMENVRGLGNVNIVQGSKPLYLLHSVATNCFADLPQDLVATKC